MLKLKINKYTNSGNKDQVNLNTSKWTYRKRNPNIARIEPYNLAWIQYTSCFPCKNILEYCMQKKPNSSDLINISQTNFGVDSENIPRLQ